MKQLKPEYLLALISALVALLAFWFEVASLNLPFSPLISALVLSLFLGVITFLVLYFGIKIFLQNRLNHLFKNLQNPPIIKAQRLNEIIDEANECNEQKLYDDNYITQSQLHKANRKEK